MKKPWKPEWTDRDLTYRRPFIISDGPRIVLGAVGRPTQHHHATLLVASPFLGAAGFT
jgi:hypothetical protein